MALYITSLNSGSNGNCYYIGNQQEAILVDAGISCREVEKRMLRLGLDIRKVKAIFVSHEHSDHITGIPVLAKKYQLPVYITDDTFLYSRLPLEKQFVRQFTGHQPVAVGGLQVTAFPKLHDAVDPHSFIVNCQSVQVGIFTDIGNCCDQVTGYFQQCHAVFLEANYDEEMLHRGKYPAFLKNRIRGGKGHLSNNQALELFTRYGSPALSHLLLSHLSKENNCPNLVKELFSNNATATEIVVASRYEETPVYHIIDNGRSVVPYRPPVRRPVSAQLSLF